MAKTSSSKKSPVKSSASKTAATKSKIQKPALKPSSAKTPTMGKPVNKVATPMYKKPEVSKAPVSVDAKAPMNNKVPSKVIDIKKVDSKLDFKVGNYVVYPTHGVGKIVAEETQKIGDISIKVFVIGFEKDKMTLRVPVTRATAAGLRNISSGDQIERAFITLKGRAKTSKGMWSRRAQEYEAKINSGSLISVAEVVRDLHKNVDQAERSYSERMIYESALSRLVGELAAAEKIDSKTATDKLIKVLRAQLVVAAA
jgi:CarD family transcriptional regulator